MTKIETPTPETICRAIASAVACGDVPVRAATVRGILLPKSIDMGPRGGTPYIRAIDRGLQSASKAKLATYDSKKGWRLTKAGRALCA
jgi:hypothetical protein